MPVVINEFEVVPEPQQRAQQRQPQAEPPAPSAPSPQEMAELLRREAGRAARVRAH